MRYTSAIAAKDEESARRGSALISPKLVAGRGRAAEPAGAAEERLGERHLPVRHADEPHHRVGPGRGEAGRGAIFSFTLPAAK